MPQIVYKQYDKMPGSTPDDLNPRFRPDDWPDDVEYHEVFELNGQWFAVMEDPLGGRQRTSGKATREEAEAAIYEHVQFTRAFWDQKVEWMNNGDMTIPRKGDGDKVPRRVARIDGHHYIVGHEPSKDELRRNSMHGGLGHGGREFKIRFHNGDEITTRNLWAQGRIDPEYLSILTDNAVFI